MNRIGRRTGTAARREAGFTLMELIIVVAIIGILTTIAIPSFIRSPDKAREAVLKTNLHTMREAFDQYFADKAKYPDSLDTLVEEGYLRAIPIDPFTQSSSTWVLQYAEDQGDNATVEEGASPPGIFDVHSGSSHISEDGTAASEW